MTPIRYSLFLSLLLMSTIVFGQYTNRTDYDIKPLRENEQKKKCGELLTVLASMPQEARFGTRFVGDSAFLIMNDAVWFNGFFKNKDDGFALDLVNRGQYQCDNITRISGSYSHRGFLLPPVYRDQIRKTMTVTPGGTVYVYAGMLPKSFKKDDVEANYVLLNDRYPCNYTSIINVESHDWDLLPMGLYYDTLTAGSREERYRDLDKVLRFQIPFEKNKAEYKPEDIKPLYDSLRLTDYEITSIIIRAYTSVEGSLERNMELQDQRANSIVKALQSFQPESIRSEVTSSENWVEFLEGIKGTSFASMSSLTKDEVKQKLADPKMAEQLESLLSKHRKALIELKLEKRVIYSKVPAAELKKYFDQSIAKKDIDEALFIQEVIFQRVRKEELPTTFAHSLEIPKSIEYAGLLNNFEAFDYQYYHHDILEAIKAFNQLSMLLKNNKMVEYNICALRIQSWRTSGVIGPGDALKKRINDLVAKGISRKLVQRLLVNYSMVMAEQYWKERKYKERDESLRYIYQTYTQLPLNDADLVSLAKYFSHNSRYEWSERALQPHVKSIDAAQDLLFFYINLTVYKPKYTSSGDYRIMLLNAVNANRSRFCHLFDPIGLGGASFQLLDDPFLKKTYCENCQTGERK